MNPTLILEIIKLSLELAIKIHADMPIELRQRIWENHLETMKFVERLFDRADPK